MKMLFAAGLVWASTVVATGSPAQAGIPERFTNLEIFADDVPRAELVATMRQYAITLGVRCWYCHEGAEELDFSEFDFASDAKPAKAIARRMQVMVNAINTTYLKDVGTPSDAPKVTCFTCHRGQARPAAGSGTSPVGR